MNKTLKVMTSAALLAGVVAPVAVTTVDAANTKNIVDKVLYVDDDYSATGENSLTIQKSDVDFSTSTGDTFRLTLPADADWALPAGFSVDGLTVINVNDDDLEFKIDAAKTEYKIPLYFNVDGAEGEVKVTVDPRGSVVTGGQYTIAVVGQGSTTASISTVRTIQDGGSIATIRLDENSLGALYDAKYEAQAQEITLTLPSDFEWKTTSGDTIFVPAGGFDGKIDDTSAGLGVSIDENKLTYKFEFTGAPTKLGTFYIQNLKIDADKDADFGEIEIDIDGDEVTSTSLVVANYGDYGTKASLESDVPTLLAGRLTDDDTDVETAEVLIKESVAGSWLPGRSVDVELPSWVKVVGVDVSGAKNFDKVGGGNFGDSDIAKLFNDDIDGDSNKISFDLPSNLDDTTSKREFKIKFYVSTKADAAGDVTVKVDGRAGIEVPETTIANVVAPVKVENEKVDVRTGIKEQPLNDIVITEAQKGVLLDGKTVQLKLSDGQFTDEDPTITVEEGNVKIEKDSVNINNGVLTFDIDGESTRASKIVISGLSLDLSRAVPEGDVTVEVGGDAIVQNSTFGDDYAFAEAKINKFGDKTFAQDTDASKSGDQPEYDLSGKVDAGEFDRDYVVKTAVATVVTPAEGNATVQPATFTIGSTTYTVGDVEKAMDVAPFVEAGRTFMPVRYVAEAAGINSDNILWDQATQTATFIKDARVAQVKVGSKSLVVNGANITMDATAKVVDGRTVIPVRFVAQALGASVNYDETTKTVTVK